MIITAYHDIYIYDFFYDINKELDICCNDKYKIEIVLHKISDQKLFVNSLDIYLKKCIDKFLHLFSFQTPIL